MSKRAALVPVMLLAGVVAAVVGATVALRFVGGGAFGPGGQPLSPADVQWSLAQQPLAGQNPTTAPASPSAPAPATSPVLTGFGSSGGTVYATCLSGQAWLANWSPAQSYQTDGVSRGPAASAWVRFKSGTSEVKITAKCPGSQPHFTTASGDAGGAAGGGGGGEVGDDHGGGGGGGGPGGGGGSGGGGSGGGGPGSGSGHGGG